MSEEKKRIQWLRARVADPLGSSSWVSHEYMRTFLSAIDARDAEIERMRSNSYPHMCRMDHERIGHRDSENERCPVCLRDDEIERLRAEVQSGLGRETALRSRLEVLATLPGKPTFDELKSAGDSRPTPTLAEVAKDIMAARVAAAYPFDRETSEGWNAIAVDHARISVNAAKELLAELERRGAKCK